MFILLLVLMSCTKISSINYNVKGIRHSKAPQTFLDKMLSKNPLLKDAVEATYREDEISSKPESTCSIITAVHVDRYESEQFLIDVTNRAISERLKERYRPLFEKNVKIQENDSIAKLPYTLYMLKYITLEDFIEISLSWGLTDFINKSTTKTYDLKKFESQIGINLTSDTVNAANLVKLNDNIERWQKRNLR